MKVLLTPDYAACWGMAELPQVGVQFREHWCGEEVVTTEEEMPALVQSWQKKDGE